MLLVVDFCGIEHASAFDGDTVIFGVYPAKEAGSITFMAGGIANLVDFQQQCVSIAVKIDGLEFLNIPAFLTLAPEFFSAAAVVADASGTEGFLPGVFVHPRHHENITGFGILSDCGDEGIGGKVWTVQECHSSAIIVQGTEN